MNLTLANGGKPADALSKEQILEREIQERQRSEQRLAVQYAVTRVLAEASNLSEAAPQIIRAVCETAGWKLGEIWELDAGAKVLRCVEIWSPAPEEFAEFKAVSRQF